MTPEKEAAIRSAAIKAHEASQDFRMRQMLNTSTDPQQALEQSIEYELSRARMIETQQALRSLQESTP